MSVLDHWVLPINPTALLPLPSTVMMHHLAPLIHAFRTLDVSISTEHVHPHHLATSPLHVKDQEVILFALFATLQNSLISAVSVLVTTLLASSLLSFQLQQLEVLLEEQLQVSLLLVLLLLVLLHGCQRRDTITTKQVQTCKPLEHIQTLTLSRTTCTEKWLDEHQQLKSKIKLRKKKKKKEQGGEEDQKIR